MRAHSIMVSAYLSNMANFTQQLTEEQLKQNIDSMIAGGLKPADVQAYVNNYKRGADGFTFKSHQRSDQRLEVSPEEEREAKRRRIAASNREIQAEAEKSTVGRFGKALLETALPSEVGLGKTIGKLKGSEAGQAKSLVKTKIGLEGSQVKILKQIRARSEAGEDVSKLSRIYNDQLEQIKEVNTQLGEETDLPTTQEVLGQIGGTALDVLAAGTFGKGAQGLKTGTLQKAVRPSILPGASQKFLSKATAKEVAGGAALGLGFDVTHGLQQGEEGLTAFKPGLATAISIALPVLGRFIPGAGRGLKSIGTKEGRGVKTVAKREKILTQLGRDKKKVRQALDQMDDDTRKVFVESDLLSGAVDKNGTVSTQEALSNFDDFIEPFEGIVRRNLAEEGTTISTSVIEKKLDDVIAGSGVTGAAKTKLLREAKQEISGLKLDADDLGDIPLEIVHQAKVTRNRGVNYLDPEKHARDKFVARAMKELVEENAVSNVIKMNEELSRLYKMRTLLEKLNGVKVEGGRLGKQFSAVIGGIAGGAAGGPLGAIGGAETGRFLRGQQLKGTLGRGGKPLEAPRALRGE